MKKIIINGRFLLHRITGVERYAREIITELDNMIQPGWIEIAIPPETKDIPNYKNISVVKVGKLKNRMWEHISFPLYVKKHNGVSLNLCNVAPLFSPGIVCIHDMKIKKRPKDFSRKFLLWYNLLFFNACKRAKKIITVSHFSKKEISKYYKINPNRIVVIPNAWQHYKKVGYDENTLGKYGLEKSNYFFSMSSFEPNKNFKWIAEEAKYNEKSVFAVAGSINKSVFAEGLGFECPDNMKLLGYVSDEEAKTLMRDCRAFLFPSYYEGFGIPPLEAISAGCNTVIVSNSEIMHEVFGEGVQYIDPDEIVELNNTPVIDNDARKIILEKYSWVKSARKLKKLLEIVKGD